MCEWCVWLLNNHNIPYLLQWMLYLIQCCRDLHARELRSWSCCQVMFFCFRLARNWIFFYLWIIWLNSILFVIYIQTKLLWCFTFNIFSQELNKHAENWMWIFFSTRGENIHRIATLLLENYINAHITTDRQHWKCNIFRKLQYFFRNL